jgi:hypothetical protein
MVPPFRVSQGVAAAKLPNGMHHHRHRHHHHNHHHHHHHHTLVPPCSHCEHQEIDQLKTHYTAFRIARAIRVLTIADHLSCTLPPRIRHRRWHDRPPHGGRSPGRWAGRGRRAPSAVGARRQGRALSNICLLVGKCALGRFAKCGLRTLPPAAWFYCGSGSFDSQAGAWRRACETRSFGANFARQDKTSVSVRDPWTRPQDHPDPSLVPSA